MKFVSQAKSIRKTLFQTLFALGCVGGLSLMPISVLAQVTTASISGTVTDRSGAVIPKAKVVLTDVATSATRPTATNGGGLFSLSAVPTGDYSLTITAPGFETFTQTGIHLDPQDQRVLRELKLSVGSESANVTVEADQAGINADSGELSSLITAEDIKHLAIEGRDVTELLKVLPGFTPGGSNGSIANTVYDPSQVGVSGALGSYHGNGTPLNGVALLSDGADITDPGNFGSSIQAVNYDQVAEVKVQTSSMTADTAHGPIVINAVGKSGANTFHGSLYTYARTTQLNSTDWYAKYAGQQKPPDRQIYPGGTLGGPVVIPGTNFNHSRRLTFWVGGEDYAQKNSYAYGGATGAVLTALVPTAGMRTGDFSQTQIQQYLGNHYKPPTMVNNVLTQNCESTYTHLCPVPVTGVDGTPISNGQITLDPGSKALLNLLPLPNVPTGSNSYNWITTNLIDNNLWQARGRLDYSLGEKTKMFVVYNTQRGLQGNPQVPYYSPRAALGGVNTPGGGEIFTHDSQLGSLNIGTIITPSLTNEFYGSLSFLGVAFNNKTPGALSNDATGFPYQGLYDNGNKTVPQLLGYGGALGLPLALWQDTYDKGIYTNKLVRTGGDNLTKQWGAHTVRLGIYGQMDSNNGLQSYVPTNGSVALYYYPETFQPINPITNLPVGPLIHDTGAVNSGSGGNYLADFAEGNIATYAQTNINPAVNLYFWNISGYVQDHWRVKPSFSLDLGVRFEHITPWGDAHGVGVPIFRDSAYYSDAAGSPLPGFLWHALDKSVPVSGAATRWAFVEPRVGFAWDVYKTGATVLRGGFGIYTAHDSYNDASLGVATAQGSLSLSPVNTTFSAVSQTHAPTNAGTVSASKLYGYYGDDDKMPQVYTWNLSIVQKMPLKSTTEIAYVGNYSNDLLNNGGTGQVNIDDINALPIGALYSKGVYSYADFATVAGLQPAQINAFRKYPTYQNLLIAQHNNYANYHALQVAWNRQSGHVLFGANYTFSKALGILGTDGGNGNPVNPFNLRDNYQPESFDRTHVFNLRYTLQVGQPVHNAFAGALLNGWELSGISNLISGANLVTTGSPSFGFGGSVSGTSGSIALSSTPFLGTPDVMLMPRLLCDPAGGLGPHQYANGACFGAPLSLGTNGNYRVPYLHGPAYISNDLTVTRNMKLREAQSLQLRLAAFNFLNHANNSFNSNVPTATSLSFIRTGTNFGSPVSSTVLGSLTNGHTDFGFAPLKGGRRILEVSVKYTF